MNKGFYHWRPLLRNKALTDKQFDLTNKGFDLTNNA